VPGDITDNIQVYGLEFKQMLIQNNADPCLFVKSVLGVNEINKFTTW